MDRQILNITANEQILSVSNPIHISTNKVSYIEARFDLGTNWSGYDSVRAVWFNDFQCISTVLDASGKCLVPFEVMKRKGNIKVNLVGSISENDVLTDRLTSYPIVAVVVDCVAQITGSETSPITPSQFEQFVDNVHDEVEVITGMSATATTLPAGSDATASYSDGVLSFGIPRGNTGATGADGNGIASISKTGTSGLVDTYTVTFTDGQTATFTVTNGAKGDTGNGITSIEKTSTAGLVDTYTITFDDGRTTTFDVTNGADGQDGADGDTGATPNISIGTVETLEPTESATASMTGTAENPVLNLGIPQGRQGEVTLSQLEQILPTDTASGSIASFSDGCSLFNAKSVVIGIEPIQSGSGTPSPDNVRPISGWTGAEVQRAGKNLAESVFAVETKNQWVTALFIDGDLLPNTTYTLSYDGIAGQAFYANENLFRWKEFVSASGRTTVTITTKASVDKSVANQYASGTGWIILKVNANLSENASLENVQLELGDTTAHSSYEPYHGTTTPVSWQTEAGTVYGGTVDVVSGVLTVDRVIATITRNVYASNWFSHDASFSTWGFYCNSDTRWRDFIGDIPVGGLISDRFPTVSSAYGTDSTCCSLALLNGVMQYMAFRIPKTAIETPADSADLAGKIMNWLDSNPIQVCFKIAPQTYQLTPTDIALLQGQNNVWADTGDVEVTYKADIQGYIDKKINALI